MLAAASKGRSCHCLAKKLPFSCSVLSSLLLLLLYVVQGPADVLSNLDLTSRQAMDRFTQHVQHCTHCKAALARTQAIAKAALATAAGCLAVACLAASARATAALAPSAVPAWLVAAAGAGCQTFGLAAPLLLLGLVAVGVHIAAKKIEQLFFYREFTRPAF